MNAVIFGINGQDGFYLKQLLYEAKIDVIGVSRSVGNWINGDVGDQKFVESIIKKYKPDYVFHLAANSTTKHEALFENHNSISTGTINLLEALRLYSPKSRTFIAGSALQFKNSGLPINEETPFEANCPYSISRIQSAYASRYYREKFGLKIYIGYLFNHDSPIRAERHVNQKIVRVVQRISSGLDEMLEIGDMKVLKEFGFAGDIVNAIWVLVNQDNVFEAVIGTGEPHSIKEWIDGCFNKVGIKSQNFITEKSDFVPDYHILVSDPRIIHSLGWQPKVDFFQLIEMMLLG